METEKKTVVCKAVVSAIGVLLLNMRYLPFYGMYVATMTSYIGSQTVW